MSYKVVKTFEKTDSQDWSGVYYAVDHSLDPTPDSRDATLSSYISDLKDKATNSNQQTKSIDGYIGNRRVFQSNNVLKIIHEFETQESAMAYFYMPVASSNPVKDYVSDVDSKKTNNQLPSYKVMHTVEDHDGNVVFASRK
jgi:hypothetical protein